MCGNAGRFLILSQPIISLPSSFNLWQLVSQKERARRAKQSDVRAWMYGALCMPEAKQVLSLPSLLLCLWVYVYD